MYVATYGDGRGRNTHEIEAPVLVEPLIFDGDDRLGQVGRDIGQRHFQPLLLENGKGEPIRIIEDGGRLVHLADAPQGVDVRKPFAETAEEPDASPEGKNRGECERHSNTGHHARMP